MFRTVLRNIVEWRDRRRIRSAFGAFVAPEVIDRLLDNPDNFGMAYEEREMTLLVCSLRGFVKRSALFKGDVQGLARFVNAFHNAMVPEILDHGGTVDKFMGDKIVAFWNAPDEDAKHAANACAAALAMRRVLAMVNETQPPDFPDPAGLFPLRIGIGIDTGLCAVGNMGSLQQFDYSALGYPVTHAARLERWCKQYETDLLISEGTRGAVPDIAALEFDLVAPARDVDPTRVYGVIGDDSLAGGEEYRRLIAEQDAFLGAYRQGNFAAARDRLARCRRMSRPEWRLSGLYDCYDARVTAFETSPPPADWSGVYVARSRSRRAGSGNRYL